MSRRSAPSSTLRRRTALLASTLGLVALTAALQAPLGTSVETTDQLDVTLVDPCGAPAAHPGGDWPSYGGDLTNSRSQALETEIGADNVGELTEAWRFEADDHAGGVINTTPIVADGCVYVAPSSGEVHAINADTGAVVWTTQMESAPAGYGGGVVGAPAVAGDLLIVVINRGGSPYLAGLDRSDGTVVWETVIDDTETAITNASVTVHDGMAMIGFSGSPGGTPAERGGFVIVDALTGETLAKTWVIPDADFAAGYAGASIWSTAAVDVDTGYAYVGAGNPHSDRVEHQRTNSILKIDLDRDRATFGEIVDSYKGNPDHYVPGANLDQQPACQDLPPVYYFASFDASCGQLDLDFGASPNLFTDADGNLLVGALQKAGVYHAAARDTMEPVWSSPNGTPCFACNASSSAFDGQRLLVSTSPPGQMVALGADDGSRQWVGPMAGGLHYYAVSHANGVAYSMDGHGYLNGFDAETGLQLLKLQTEPREGTPLPSSIGTNGSTGVAIARNTVYAALEGRVMAFQLGDDSGDGDTEPPEPPADIPPVGTSVVAQPGSQFSGYTTPAMVVQQGGELTFVNGDIASHDVVALEDYGPDTAPWCGPFKTGECPLFWSPLIGLGATTDVQGMDQVEPGETYVFYCTLHPNMQGTLVVAPAGAGR